jgi:hypothetical protein
MIKGKVHRDMINAAKKLYLHIGTPKTGTSALQFYLYENRKQLTSCGIAYPASLVGSQDDPKHQPFFGIVRSGNRDRFDASLQVLCSELANHHSLILSSEGFYHHIHELTEQSWLLIRELARTLLVKVVVYLRPQYEYVESMYRQYMKNPRGINAEYGSAMTIHELIDRPRIRQNLDYFDSLGKWASAVGEDHIVVRRYTKNVVADFLSVLKAAVGNHELRLKRNVSLSREMAEFLRSINASVDDVTRDRLIAAMEETLEWRPPQNDRTILSPSEGRALMERYRDSNCRVARTWLNENDLFPDYEIRDSDSWMPVRVDRAHMLTQLNKGTRQDDPALLR